MLMPLGAAAASLVLAVVLTVRAEEGQLPVVALHDNTTPAGRAVGGEHVLALEIQRAMWHPYGGDRPGREMFAFAERGAAPMMPAPMLRVPTGTNLRVSVSNPTDSTFVVHGLQSRQAAADSMILRPRESREVRFAADVEGTFYYYATFLGQGLSDRRFEDANLAGAFVVDPPGARPKNEHVIVMSMSFDTRTPEGGGDVARELAVMNGRPWPFTPRLTYDLGDSVRFRFINVTNDVHPMHLHGAFFRVDSKGRLLSDSVYGAPQRRMAVTELLPPGATTRLVWSPERPGGWLLHCHFFPHTALNPGFGAEAEPREVHDNHKVNGHPGHDPRNHIVEGMGGLMMAVEIRPPAGWTLNAPARRRLRLVIPNDSAATDNARFFTPSVVEEGRVTAPVTREGPGAPLILRRGEPTSIQVVNESPDPSSIHQHGMELESFFDGVVGVGGAAGQVTPPAMPRDSFEVRMTPPRAGTFIYHTHFLELRQMARGLYGAMIVMPPGEEFDARRDHVYLMSVVRKAGGAALNAVRGELPAMTVGVDETHRLRFVNVTLSSGGLRAAMIGLDSALARWTAVAKDGWELPGHQRLVRAAEQTVSIGETYDFTFTPAAAGRYVVQMRNSAGRVLSWHPIDVVAR